MARILIGNIKGPAGTMKVGTVTTGAAGSKAAVTNRGTASSAVLDFTIPQGAQGTQGQRGPTGPMPPLINNLTTNQAGAGALDAVQGKALADKDASLQTAIDTLTRKKLPYTYFREITNSGGEADYYIDISSVPLKRLCAIICAAFGTESALMLCAINVGSMSSTISQDGLKTYGITGNYEKITIYGTISQNTLRLSVVNNEGVAANVSVILPYTELI